MIPISKPAIGEEEVRAATEVLRSGQIAQGRKVEEFEKAFAEYCGTKHAVAVNSGTAALHSALYALGVKQGDEVITSPFSFIATANSIIMTGAKPVFADIEPQTFNIDPEKVLEAATTRAKAVMPVHLYGLCADMKKLNEIAEDNKLLLVEDACQSHGAECGGKRAGALGTVGCFSFYATKNMTTAEGGMVTTGDSQTAERVKAFRHHGQKQRYLHDDLGYNYRMTDVMAAVGIEQLKKLEGFTAKRIANAALYSKLLAGVDGVTAPRMPTGMRHVFHQYTVSVGGGRRDALKDYLQREGVGTAVYYPIPLHLQPWLKQLGYSKGDFPNAEKAAGEVLSLPVHPGVSEQDIGLVCEKIREFYGGA